jgi:hypothetical protein
VELLKSTAGIASVLVEDFARDVLPGARAGGNPLRSVAVECGDFFLPQCLAEWRRADFVFCNCVTWDDVTMELLSVGRCMLTSSSSFSSSSSSRLTPGCSRLVSAIEAQI